MANYRQAPVLRFNGEKCQNNLTNCEYRIPQSLMDIIFNELGNASAQLRVMLVLVGTKPDDFNVSEKWLLERTGISPRALSDVRKALSARGWVSFDQGNNITVNFDAIYGNRDATVASQNKKESPAMIASQKPAMIASQSPAMNSSQKDATIASITIKEQNNKTDKEQANSLASVEAKEFLVVETTRAEAIQKYGNLITNRIPTGNPNEFWINGERVHFIDL